MFSSQLTRKDIILAVYQSNRTVFRLKDIAMLTHITDFQSLNKKLNYYVHAGKLLNPRKGLYAKPPYDPEELACSIYTPCYISLEYVLQKAGVIFQYDEGIIFWRGCSAGSPVAQTNTAGLYPAKENRK